MSGAATAVTVDITPTFPTELFGYNARSGHSNGVGERLEANVLVLEDHAEPIFVVAVDALYGGQFRRLLSSRLGVEDDRVLVLGSHTHFAPGVDSGLPLLGPTSTPFMAWAADRIVSAVEARDNAESVMLGYGQAAIEGLFVNRRRPTFGVGIPIRSRGSVVIAPHPRGHVDDLARSVTLTVGDRPVAVLWGVSCHPVCSPDPRQVSACFVGAVRHGVRDSWSAPDLPRPLCPRILGRCPSRIHVTACATGVQEYGPIPPGGGQKVRAAIKRRLPLLVRLTFGVRSTVISSGEIGYPAGTTVRYHAHQASTTKLGASNRGYAG